jgi:hypothetical protein
MSFTRIFRQLNLSHAAPFRSIYSASHPDEMAHLIAMHDAHGHSYGALFDRHSTQSVRNLHTEAVSQVVNNKQDVRANEVEHTASMPKFKAW